MDLVKNQVIRYSIDMKVKEINSISKEDGYIYYINRYKGNAVLEILAKEKVSTTLTFFPYSIYCV